MRHTLFLLACFASAAAAQLVPALSQTELAVPGGATGADVFCLQAGSLTSGTFAGTLLQTDSGTWEQRSNSGTSKFDVKTRDDLMVELYDASRKTTVQVDFVTKTIRERPSDSKGAWTDLFVILNATDQAKSKDCISLASHSPESESSAAVSEDEDVAEPEAKRSKKSSDSSTKTKKSSKQSTKTTKASRSSKKSKSASKSSKARSKKSSKPGFSIGIGVGGVGIGF